MTTGNLWGDLRGELRSDLWGNLRADLRGVPSWAYLRTGRLRGNRWGHTLGTWLLGVP